MSDKGFLPDHEHRELAAAPTASKGDSAAVQFGRSHLADSFGDAYAGVRNLGLARAQFGGRGTFTESDERERFMASEKISWHVAVGILLLAAIPRAITIFLLTGADHLGIGWYQDAFHHWQIAYLSKEIGFSQGFLRLWDFKGMEYVWGVAHPLATAGLFGITGSIDLLIPRLLGLVAGSAAVLYLFLLVRRYFGAPAAFGAALITALNPVVILSDTGGVQEPIGIMLLLGGLYFWPERPILAGVSLGLAGTARAEYWVFGLGLCLVSFLVERKEYKNMALVGGWAIPTFAYMRYLSAYTGNPIYPVYWYFRGAVVGEWMGDAPLQELQITAVWIARTLLPLFALAAYVVIKKRARYSLFALLGLGVMIFLSIMLGSAAYVRYFSYRILLDRIFVLPHIYLGALAGIVLLSSKPRRRLKLWVGAVGIAVLALVSQAMWLAIRHYAEPWDSFWTSLYDASSEIAEMYQGGVISIPEDRPEFTYFLARYHGIAASALQSQMYDAFAYLEGDPFADYAATKSKLRQWLTENNINLIVMYSDNSQYAEMIDRNPDWFTFAGFIMDGRLRVFWVHPGGHGTSGQSGDRARAK